MVGGKKKETATQRERRLRKAREKYAEKKSTESLSQKEERLKKGRLKRSARTSSQRERDSILSKQKYAEKKSKETPSQRSKRLESLRENRKIQRENEIDERRSKRLAGKKKLILGVETKNLLSIANNDWKCRVCWIHSGV